MSRSACRAAPSRSAASRAPIDGGVCAGRTRIVCAMSSDRITFRSDRIRSRFIGQLQRCQEREAINSASATRPKASMTSGVPQQARSLGAAQSVHSRGSAKEPRSGSSTINVSTPPTHRVFRTTNRLPRKGWNGWVTSVDPEGLLGRSAVRRGRRCADLSLGSADREHHIVSHPGGTPSPLRRFRCSVHTTRRYGRSQFWASSASQSFWRPAPSTPGRSWEPRRSPSAPTTTACRCRKSAFSSPWSPSRPSTASS